MSSFAKAGHRWPLSALPTFPFPAETLALEGLVTPITSSFTGDCILLLSRESCAVREEMGGPSGGRAGGRAGMEPAGLCCFHALFTGNKALREAEPHIKMTHACQKTQI